MTVTQITLKQISEGALFANAAPTALATVDVPASVVKFHEVLQEQVVAIYAEGAPVVFGRHLEVTSAEQGDPPSRDYRAELELEIAIKTLENALYEHPDEWQVPLVVQA